MIDPHLAITIPIGTIAMIIATDIDQDFTPTIIDTGVTVTVTHAEVTPGHITNSQAAAHHTTETQVHIAMDETPHTEGPHHTEVFPGIAVDPDHVHHTNTTTEHQQDCLTALTKQLGEPKRGNISKSPLMIHCLSTIALMSKPANQTMI